MRPYLATLALAATILAGLAGCSGDESTGGSPGGRSGRGGPGRFGGGGGERPAAVPVEAATVERRDISSYIETNGALEAENEVDIVARTSGLVVELLAEETMVVRKGQRLARLDQDQVRVNLEVARVDLHEAELAHRRTAQLHEQKLVSGEIFEVATARVDSARAKFRGAEIQFGYTEIRAPFDGIIIERYVKAAENVSTNTPLFRISDFDPLLCRIQVPEGELGRLRQDQIAFLTVEPFGDERFPAQVLRISPVIDSETGTIRVTLVVEASGKLRPGMFASVFVRAETHRDAVVIPRAALALESIGDTVYVVRESGAERREVRLGVREGESVQVLEGLAGGEQVVIIGQDGLSDGTPIQVLRVDGAAPGAGPAAAEGEIAQRDGGHGDDQRAQPSQHGGGRGGFDPSKMTPEMLEAMKERMRQRGMTDEQIAERLKRFAARSERPHGDGQ